MLNNAKKTPHAFGMRCLFVMEDEEMSSYSYDPKSLKAEEFNECHVVNDFDEFVNKSDIVLCNRIDDKIKKHSDKIYTRDLFNEN